MSQPIKFGKYYLLERLAVGGMAEIYKAKIFGVDGFEKQMVVKQILPQYARNREFVTMFIDEAKITVSLSHGNIVPVYELGQIDGIYFLSMDYIDGKNLGELLDAGIEAKNLLSVPHALFIACEVLAGLDYAHRKTDERGNPLNIVHRDVSPQNILISFDGSVKIVDFGIAHAATKAHATQAGVIKGKFGYMSPEQALGKDVDSRSDIFTAGILLWEMLTLERLFGGESDTQALDRIKRADVPPPSPNCRPNSMKLSLNRLLAILVSGSSQPEKCSLRSLGFCTECRLKHHRRRFRPISRHSLRKISPSVRANLIKPPCLRHPRNFFLPRQPSRTQPSRTQPSRTQPGHPRKDLFRLSPPIWYPTPIPSRFYPNLCVLDRWICRRQQLKKISTTISATTKRGSGFAG
jgi:serine/threonine protein kinase